VVAPHWHRDLLKWQCNLLSRHSPAHIRYAIDAIYSTNTVTVEGGTFSATAMAASHQLMGRYNVSAARSAPPQATHLVRWRTYSQRGAVRPPPAMHLRLRCKLPVTVGAVQYSLTAPRLLGITSHLPAIRLSPFTTPTVPDRHRMENEAESQNILQASVQLSFSPSCCHGLLGNARLRERYLL
jgi:hypothetical protein